MSASTPTPVIRILYADDNSDHLELFRASLRSYPFPIVVLSASTGREAIEILQKEPVDLIVLDYRLPDCTGVDLIKEVSGPGRPPVIIITGAGDEKIAVAAMKLGAYDYVVKDDLIGEELPKAISSALVRHTETQRKDEERAKLAEMAFTDALTGLRNRRFFNESFEREFASVKRYGRQLALLLIDFDHFKRINDSYGHGFGDLVLADSAKALLSLVRSADLVARYGGEEIVALLPDTDVIGGTILAERMRRIVSEIPFRSEKGEPVTVTLSIGLACQGGTGGFDGPTEFLSAADAALYRAKNAGRNQVVVAEEPESVR